MRCSSSTLASLPVARKSTVASSFASAADGTSTQPSPRPQNPIQTPRRRRQHGRTLLEDGQVVGGSKNPPRRTPRLLLPPRLSLHPKAQASAPAVGGKDEHDYLFVVGVCMCCVPACLVGVCAIACVYLLQDTQGRHFRDDHNSARWSQMVTFTFQRWSGVNIGPNTLRAAFVTYLLGTDGTDDTLPGCCQSLLRR